MAKPRPVPPTLVHALARAAELDAQTAGLRWLDARERPTWLRWPEVVARALHVAGGLRAAGVRQGDVVALILPTSPGFGDAFFGAVLAGAVPVCLYPPVRLGRLDAYVARTTAMLSAAGAVALLTDARAGALLGRVVEAARLPRGVHDVATLRQAPPISPAQPGPDDLAMLQFSSGTTVAPKPVALSHAAVLANASRVLDLVVATDPLDGPNPAGGATWLPLYHDMGLIGCILPAILAPGPLTLLPPEAFLARPAAWLRMISRYRATISPAPDFAYALCTERVRDEDLEGVDLSSWSLALDGAEPIAPDTLRAFAARFARFGLRPTAPTPVYGLSEMALAVTASAAHTPPKTLWVRRGALSEGRVEVAEDGAPDARELVSVGRPLRDHDVRIVRAADDPDALGEDLVGRVQASGPSRMRGYLRVASGAPPDPFFGPWLDTGDLGFLHDGQLYITGRAKDLLVLRGRNHAPQDVELAASGVSGVRTGCVVAVADTEQGRERLIVLAEVRAPADDLAARIEAAVRAEVGVTPDLVVLLDPGALPRTSSGKLRRGEALRALKAGKLVPPDAVTAWRLAGALAASAWGYVASWRR